MSAENIALETSLLRIFRLFVVVALVFEASQIAGYLFLLNTGPPLVRVVALVIQLLLLIYLWLPWPRRLLGEAYLPLGLAVATLLPIIEQQLLLWGEMVSNGSIVAQPFWVAVFRSSTATTQTASATGSWLPMLFVPLVIIAWRYGFRSVVIFCIATAATDAALSFALTSAGINGPFGWVDVIAERTLAFLFVGYMVVQLAGMERQQRHQLQQANAHLAQQATVLEQLAVTRERNRLARDLHDTLAHTLSASSVQLEASLALWDSRPQKARELVEQVRLTIHNGLTDTRRALEALRSSALQDLGLTLALRQLAEQYAQRIGWHLTVAIPNELCALSPAVEDAIYRCAQEGMSNIDRHAGASEVALQLGCDAGAVTLILRDNGRGFDPAGVDYREHFGLMGMRERVQALGGHLEIVSRPDQGTVLTLTLDCEGVK